MTKQPLAFTLLETVLYVFIFAILGIALFNFGNISYRTNAYSQSVAEVDLQGSAAMLKIITAINNVNSFDGINYPGLGLSSTTLSLKTATTSTNPIIFSLASSSITMKVGTSTPVSLTSNRVEVSNLLFSNFGRAMTDGVIQIKYTITLINNSGMKEYTYSKDFVSAANPLVR